MFIPLPNLSPTILRLLESQQQISSLISPQILQQTLSKVAAAIIDTIAIEQL